MLSVDAGDAERAASLSAYELQRLDNIRRNEEVLRSLGLMEVKCAVGRAERPRAVAKASKSMARRYGSSDRALRKRGVPAACHEDAALPVMQGVARAGLPSGSACGRQIAACPQSRTRPPTPAASAPTGSSAAAATL